MSMTHKEAVEKASRYAAMIPIPDAEDLTEFLRAYIEARGLVLVPKEATNEMCEASVYPRENWMTVPRVSVLMEGSAWKYRAMIAAAPDPFKDDFA